MGFIVSPFYRLNVRQLQQTEACIGTKTPISALVPLLPFLPTSAVYATLSIAGLLHPAASWGSLCFGTLKRGGLPTTRYPTKLFPDQQLPPRHPA
jgi:hypothetical protein